MSAFLIIVSVVAGLFMGSFLNRLAWRIVHGGGVFGRSRCPACSHALSARDLIPVFSWLACKGRCRYCSAPVSRRYPAAELLCAVVYATTLMRYGFSLEAFEMAAFASVLLVASLTDIDAYLIPNGCIVAAIAVRAAYIAAVGAFLGQDAIALAIESIISGVVVFVALLLVVLLADKVMGRESMGGGDLKLLFVAGLFFGWRQCLFLIVVACIFGIVAALIPRTESAQPTAGGFSPADASVDARGDIPEGEGGTALSRVIPFGPSIALACWITMLAGSAFTGWYASLV